LRYSVRVQRAGWGEKMHRSWRFLQAAALVLAAVSMAIAAVAGAQDTCGDLTTQSAFGAAKIVAVTPVAADAGKHLPAFCEVRVTISPVAGSQIGAVYRLPADWNGKVLGIGGGGFAGNLRIESAAEGLSRGYAVIQNDLGHPSPNALDPSFALDAQGKPNVEGIIDFGHRATHLATTVAKDLATRRYGRAPRHAYWQGCSTGGRQGLAEVQRYPDDYDGVIAGAPVYTPLTYSNAILRVQAFHAKPESNLRPAHVKLIHDAVLAACDARDGIRDGILNDPRACAWDPRELACKAGEFGDQCLTPTQVETVRRVYAGVKTKDGKFAAMPLMRGGESDWVARMIGTAQMPNGLNAVLGAPFMSYIVKAAPKYDIFTFDPERDMAALDGGIAAAEVHQQNPDIAAFVARGGKLLLWHGFNDPGPSPLSTIAYLDAVNDHVRAAKDSVRLFLAPGVLHCGGGAGPDRLDTLSALERWVEEGQAPARIIATKANSSLQRPLCPYPQLANYKGGGDTNDPANFECASP
jgi:Tannase and feruloyl esterase